MQWTVFQENIGILGIQGSGKTTLCRQILDTIPNIPRLIISPQKPREHYGRYGTPIDDISHITQGRAQYWTGDFSKQTMERIAAALMSRCYNMVLVIDDVQEFCTKQKIFPAFNRLIQSGRNRGICSIFLSPSPNLVNNYILQSCHHVYAFQMNLESQIEWIQKNLFGNDAWILLQKSRRKKEPETVHYEGEILPPHSCLYKHYSSTNSELFLGGAPIG